MPYFQKCGIFHIHNPRCGGTSINKAFWQAGLFEVSNLRNLKPDRERFYGVVQPSMDSPRLELDHLCISQVLERMDPVVTGTLTFISTVRDPWQRFVSEYHRKKERNDKRMIDPAELSLTDFLEKFLYIVTKKPALLGNQFQAGHFWRQVLFASFRSYPAISKSYLLRLENLHEDWEKLRREYPFELPGLSKANKAHRDINSHSEENKMKRTSLFKEFREYYKTDYEEFGYD
jgi:hypothetical protein